MSTAATKMRWSDLDENDDDGEVGVGDLGYLLPPRVVVGPDENGIKKTVEYRFNEEGRTVRVTTTTRVREVARTRVTKRAAERRGWAKFGAAADDLHDAAAAHLTVVSPEEIVLERPRAPGTKSDDPLIPALDKGAALMICRICGAKGSHWTSKCPNKDLATHLDSLLDNNNMPPTSDNTTNNAGSGKYVPPRPKDSEMRRRNDENSVRVSNLSEDTREEDIRELFGSFGPLTRAYVALDHRTGESRGFGFVSFVYKEHAENAISKLNGYGYDSLILHVEWAAPRPN
uniref:Eukaryotic translation initiation factor 3 subunit G n=1 Tax=Leersia perrieri TaxID=77586 RepID=A0A0D9VLZ3_9ORYZ